MTKRDSGLYSGSESAAESVERFRRDTFPGKLNLYICLKITIIVPGHTYQRIIVEQKDEGIGSMNVFVIQC